MNKSRNISFAKCLLSMLILNIDVPCIFQVSLPTQRSASFYRNQKQAWQQVTSVLGKCEINYLQKNMTYFLQQPAGGCRGCCGSKVGRWPAAGRVEPPASRCSGSPQHLLLAPRRSTASRSPIETCAGSSQGEGTGWPSSTGKPELKLHKTKKQN